MERIECTELQKQTARKLLECFRENWKNEIHNIKVRKKEDGKIVLVGRHGGGYYHSFAISDSFLMFYGNFDECEAVGFGDFRGLHSYHGEPFWFELEQLYQEILAELIEYRRKELLLLEGLKDGE